MCGESSEFVARVKPGMGLGAKVHPGFHPGYEFVIRDDSFSVPLALRSRSGEGVPSTDSPHTRRDFLHEPGLGNIELRRASQRSNAALRRRFYTAKYSEAVGECSGRSPKKSSRRISRRENYMRHPLSALAALCFMLVPVALQMPVAHAAGAVPAAAQTVEPTARVIVKYKAGSSLMRALGAASDTSTTPRAPQHAAALSTRHGLTMTDGAPTGTHSQVLFAKGMTSAKLAELLSKDSDVEYAEPDLPRRAQSVPNDPLYPDNLTTTTPVAGQWYLRPPTATNVSAINAEGAWNTTMGSATIVVAVLDTGIRFDHPDLVGKTYAGYDFVSDL